MPLSPGAKLGPYEIVDAIGAGGMGEVYRARDTRLDRTVAIKILPTHLSDRPDLKERFDREAKAISSLNHPNICSLFDVGHESGTDYLVMEFIEGQSLSEVLLGDKLLPEKVVQIGLQIAGALEKAHRAGIVHRDLKPGNVMLTREGVKLLDFGLAKLTEVDSVPDSGSLPGLTGIPTMTGSDKSPLTAAGTILGTFQYMAPEQLEGKEADPRTDIFALGALLYEMATGHKAFHGESQASLIASIMGTQPRPISELTPLSPPGLDRVVSTCLAKDPEDRFQTAHDVALQLKWIAEGGSEVGVPVAVSRKRRVRERISWILVGVFAALAAALAVLFVMTRPEPDDRVVRFTMSQELFSTGVSYPTVSPDGRYIAFRGADSLGVNRIYLRAMDDTEMRAVPGTEDSWRPFWSPDSRHLGFFTPEKAKRVPIGGGPSQTLATTLGYDGSWGKDFLLYDITAGDSLHMIPVAGGEPAPASSFDRSLGESGHVWPQFLPDGEHFLFLSIRAGSEDRYLKAGRVGSLESRKVADIGSRFQYVAPGYILFVRDGALFAQPFDAKAIRTTGDAVPVAEGVSTSGGSFGGSFSVSQNGVLAFWQGASGGVYQMNRTDRMGNGVQFGETGSMRNPALSPDDRYLAISVEDSRTGTNDIWVWDLERGTRSRMTFDPGEDADPIYSPDGQTILFSSNRTGSVDLYTLRARGGALPDSLYGSPDADYPCDWSRDGRWIAFSKQSSAGLDLWALDMQTRQVIPVATAPYSEDLPKFSPDGNWIAYQSRQSGRFEIYVQRFPESDGIWQVSTGSGMGVQWGPDGTEMFYLTQELELMRVEVDLTDGFRASVPELMFRPNVRGANELTNRFLVTSDGQEFLFNGLDSGDRSSPITVVLNWDAELRGRR